MHMPPEVNIPSHSSLADNRSSKLLLTAAILGFIAVGMTLGWGYTVMRFPHTETFSMVTGGVRLWEVMDGRIVKKAATPASFKEVPHSLLREGEVSAVYTQNGSIIALSPAGLIAVDRRGARTVLIDGSPYDSFSSGISGDASWVALQNKETQQFDIFDLDAVRPVVLSYLGSLPSIPTTPERYVGAIGFSSTGDVVTRESGTAGTFYNVYHREKEIYKKIKEIPAPQTATQTAFLRDLFSIETAHAYTYGNPIVQAGSVTTFGKKCTGTLVASLGVFSGIGDYGPGAASALWSMMNKTGIPSDYTTLNKYCFQGFYSIGSTAGAEPEPKWNANFGVYNGTGTVSATNYYSLIYNGVATASLTFALSPATISQGDSALLTWNAANVSSCTPTGFSIGGLLSGSLSVSPTASTTYSIQCAGLDGSSLNAARTLVVLYNPDLIAGTPTPSTSAVNTGQVMSVSVPVSNIGVGATGAGFPVVLQRLYYGANSTLYSGGTFGVGNIVSSMLATTTQTITVSGVFDNTPNGNPTQFYVRACADLDGNYAGSINERDESNNCGPLSGPISVTYAAPTGVTAYLTAGVASVAHASDPVTLTWSSSNANECSSPDFATGGATSGTKTVFPTTNTTYTLTCSNNAPASGSGVWEKNSSSVWDGWCSPGATQPSSAVIPQGTCTAANGFPGGHPTVGVACTAPNSCSEYIAVNCGNVVEKEYYCSTPSSLQTSDPSSATVAISATPLSTSCSVSPSTVSTNQNVTWTALASGGIAPYTYAWSGTDGLTGTSAGVVKSYSTIGIKTGSVTVTDTSASYAWVKTGTSVRQGLNPNCSDYSQVPPISCTASNAYNSYSCSNGDAATQSGYYYWSDYTCTPSSGSSITQACSIGGGGVTGGGSSVTVTNAPTLTCTNPVSCVISTGGSETLHWDGGGASSCTGNGFNTGGATSGTVQVTPSSTTSYSVTCDGTSAPPVTVTVTSTPTAFITAAPSRVLTGGSVNVAWSAASVTSCSLTKNGNAFNPVPLGGSLIPNGSGVLATSTIPQTITGQTIYKLTCDGVTSTAIVNVNAGETEF